MPESGGVPIGQLLSNGPKVFLRVCELLLLTAGVSHAAHQMILLLHSLLPQVIAVQVPLVFPWSWGAAQAEAVVRSLCDVAVDPVVFRDLPTMVPAIGIHCRQTLQRAILPQGIHDHLELFLELLGVELITIVRPPRGPELLSS